METLQRTANRGSISTGPYDIDNSVKFESANTESLTKSQTASNRKTWTLSFWFKRTKVNADLQYTFQANVSSSTVFDIMLNGTTDWRISDYTSGSRSLAFYSTVPLRDASAWYHLVVACDTTQSTSTDRFKIYLNGVQVDTISGYFSTAQYPAEDYETNINNSAATLSIGKSISASTNFCGYMAEVNFIDGLMKDEEDFGEFDSDSGIWIPKQYTGSYGNEGYYLDFADASDLGDDESGNGKDFTENNITAADQATDTPTNNFCTLNPLNVNSATASNNPTYTEGNTRTTSTLDDYWQTAIATIGVTSGKWYMEGQLIYDPAMAGIGVGDFGDIENWGRNNDNVMVGKAIGYGTPKAEVGDSLPATANDYTNSNIIGVALDADNGKVYWSRDNVYQSSMNPVTGANGISIPTGGDAEGLYMFAVSAYKATHGSYTGNAGWLVNFGGFTNISISSAASDANGYGTFEYAPPSGYYALCTKNLAEYG